MNAEQTALSKQLAALAGFRWEAGMRVVRDDGEAYTLGCAVAAAKVTDPSWRPCLADPATGGVLLGWLAKMGVLLSVSPLAGVTSGGFAVVTFRPPMSVQWRHQGDTLAEACARALVAIGRAS